MRPISKRFLILAVTFSVALFNFAEAASPVELKPACSGLCTSGWHKLPDRDLPFIDWATINLQWANLEPADQQFDGPDWQKIEDARKLHKHLRIRVLCGIFSPDWVKQIGGFAMSDLEHGVDCSKSGGIAIWNKFSNRGGATPAFWLPEVLDEYEELMSEIARRYEDDPQVCEVINSACMTTFAEPFYRAHADAPSNERLWKAGLNQETDLSAHKRAMQIHSDLFKKTRTSLAINPWDVIDDSEKHFHVSWDATYQFLLWAEPLMGERLTVQNNGFFFDTKIDEAMAQDPSESNYAYLIHYPGSRGLQPRQQPKGEQEEKDLMKMALRAKPTYVEYNAYYDMKEADLKAADEELEKNATLSNPFATSQPSSSQPASH